MRPLNTQSHHVNPTCKGHANSTWVQDDKEPKIER